MILNKEVKLKLIKKQIIKISLLYILLNISLSSIYILISYEANQKILNNNEVTNYINSIESEIVSINRKTQEVREAKELWNNIEKNYKVRQGLQIDKAKIILDDLKQIYNLQKNIIIDLSTPTELHDIYKTDTTVITSSIVNISFTALNDVIVFQIFDAIKKNFPGFVTFKQFTINRQSEINDAILKKINKGEIVEIVNASATFEWKDFKDVEKKN